MLARISLTLFLSLSLSLVIRLYHLSLPAGLLDYTQCPYRTVVGKFLLVSQHLHLRVKRSIGEHHLWVHPYFSSSLIWMVLEMGGWCWYSCYFVVCYFQDLFNIAPRILVQFPFIFFFLRFVSVHVVHPYSRIDTIAAWKKLHFSLSDKSDFHMIDNLSIVVHAFARRILMSFSVDETLLPRYMNLFTNFREPSFCVKMFCLQWHGGQYNLLLVPDCEAEIRLGQVYLQAALCHLHCLRP